MTIQLKKFGNILISRPAGREAWLAAKAYVLPERKKEEKIEIDFKDVSVLAPSWADEFLTPLIERAGGVSQTIFVNVDNSSVRATLKALGLA